MIKNYDSMSKRKLSEYMETLSLDEDEASILDSKKPKKKTCSVHCQTDEKMYSESDIKEMITNYVNHINSNQYVKNIEPSMWVKSF